MKRKLVVIDNWILILAGLLGLSIVLQVVAQSNSTSINGNYSAIWAHSPKDLMQTNDLAEKIVVGKVISIRRGKDIITSVSQEPNGVDRIPTEVVTLKIDQTLKGKHTRFIKLFHTGISPAVEFAGRKIPKHRPDNFPIENESFVRPTAEQAKRFRIADDPEYTLGESYVLFLTNGPKLETNLMRVVAPEGRLRLSQSEQIEPVVMRGPGKFLQGKPLLELARALQSVNNGSVGVMKSGVR